MKVPEPEEERPLAWTAILQDTPVIDAAGQDIGPVADVLGAEDIFHGIVVHAGPEATEVMIPADNVTTITNRRIETDLSPEQIRDLPPYQADAVYQLGFVGLLRRHLGWTREENDQDQIPR